MPRRPDWVAERDRFEPPRPSISGRLRDLPSFWILQRERDRTSVRNSPGSPTDPNNAVTGETNRLRRERLPTILICCGRKGGTANMPVETVVRDHCRDLKLKRTRLRQSASNRECRVGQVRRRRRPSERDLCGTFGNSRPRSQGTCARRYRSVPGPHQKQEQPRATSL